MVRLLRLFLQYLGVEYCNNILFPILCVVNALIKCRKCHFKFNPSVSLGKWGKPITTCHGCSEKANAKKTESRITTFKSLPAYDDFLTSLHDFVNSNSSGPWKWEFEFRHMALASKETLKDLTSVIACCMYEITGFRWTWVNLQHCMDHD